jgi:hypothetical protein
MGKENIAGNKMQGTQFETIFKKQALMQGFFVEKNLINAKLTYSGGLQRVFGELDWKLVLRSTGQIGFFDTKSFEGKFFTYSNLTEHQVKRAALWNELKIPAGFVIWFRPLDAVVFFTGEQISNKGERARFLPKEGVYLGKMIDFALGNLFL